MILVDTSVWIDFFKGEETSGVQCLERFIEEEVDIFTSGIIIQELLSGIKRKRERIEVKESLDKFIIIMPSVWTHVQAAELYDGCRKKGYTIRSGVDCLIAALALEYDLKVLENDKDYKFISKAFPLKLQMHG